MMLGHSVSTKTWVSSSNVTQRQTYTLIREPGLDSRIPELKRPCGDSPLVSCVENAIAPPINFVRDFGDKPAVADTLVAKVVQLFTRS